MAVTQPRKLLLWDIDGTLLSSSNAGRRAMIRVMREAHDIETALDEIDIRGACDQRIIRELFIHHRLPDRPEAAEAFFELYYRILVEEMPKGKVALHPGIGPILEAVAARSDLAQGLLTGNMTHSAQLKLAYTGIWNRFPFGAFGNDSHNRNELGPVAVRRAQEHHKTTFDPRNVFVIGDTPHDIACGRVIGAQVIAVATGGHSYEELETLKPDALFANLSDAAAFMAVIER